MASNAVKRNGSVLLSRVPGRGIMVQPSRAATEYEVVQAGKATPELVNGLSWTPIEGKLMLSKSPP